MGKIKLNLVSGAVVEKPLISAFKANNFEYVVLDNEMNGSMGLPIILVCKLDNGKLVKIADQNEWQIVKEYLKNIIAGSQVEYIKVATEIPADDIYYTQLTLPVPSFDTLKNSYKIDDNVSSSEAGIMDINPEVTPSPTPDVTPSPVSEVTTPTPEVAVQPSEPVIPEVNVGPVASSVTNVTPSVEPVVSTPEPPIPTPSEVTQGSPTPVAPVVDTPSPSAPVIDMPVSPTPTAPTIDLNTPMPTVDSPVTPQVEPTIPEVNVTPEVTPSVSPTQTVVEPAPSIKETNESPFKEQKDAFMQACENMFDALVQKFEKELEKNK